MSVGALERDERGTEVTRTADGGGALVSLAVCLGLAALLWIPIAPGLWGTWRVDDTLGHGPFIPLISAALLWTRRRELRVDAAYGPGLGLLVASALLHVLSVWVDIAFLQPLSLIGIAAGAIGYVGGPRALAAAAGPLGFLVFMIPWPTTLVEKIAFPLQLTSSSYAALLCGLLGLPIHREGVHLSIQPNPDAEPVYSVLVARQCSGLTSMLVLLALGYLIAYATPVRFGWKALLLAAIVPLALLTNSVRLTLILVAGAHHGEALATWVHDHEAPVLLFFCCLALLGIRSAILNGTTPRKGRPGGASGEAAPVLAH